MFKHDEFVAAILADIANKSRGEIRDKSWYKMPATKKATIVSAAAF